MGQLGRNPVFTIHGVSHQHPEYKRHIASEKAIFAADICVAIYSSERVSHSHAMTYQTPSSFIMVLAEGGSTLAAEIAQTSTCVVGRDPPAHAIPKLLRFIIESKSPAVSMLHHTSR